VLREALAPVAGVLLAAIALTLDTTDTASDKAVTDINVVFPRTVALYHLSVALRNLSDLAA